MGVGHGVEIINPQLNKQTKSICTCVSTRKEGMWAGKEVPYNSHVLSLKRSQEGLTLGLTMWFYVNGFESWS